MERDAIIALIQGGERGTDIGANQARNLELIDRVAQSDRPDFIVFDELSTTPYFPIAKRKDEYFKWAETIPGPYIELVGQKARRYQCCIVVPMFERTTDGYYNSAAVLGPDGALIEGRMPDGSRVKRYAKVHVPTVRTKVTSIDEKEYFDSGPGFPLFRTPKALVGIAICYDRRFPETCRTLALQGAEIVFLPANFPLHPTQGDEGYFAETRTRAGENHVYFVSCNKAGPEKFEGVTTNYIGRSCVAGPDGDIVDLPGPSDVAAILSARVDLTRIETANQRMPIFQDRKPEKYLNVAPKEVSHGGN